MLSCPTLPPFASCALALARDLRDGWTEEQTGNELNRLAQETAARAAAGLCPAERPTRRAARTSLTLTRSWTGLTETRVRQVAGERYRVEVL